MIHCAPGKDSRRNHEITGTCWSEQRLRQIAKELDVKGADRMGLKDLGRSVKRALRRRNLTTVSSGNSVRPPKPLEWIGNEFKWLNSLDILAAMKQYEKGYPGFRFAGVFPRDFANLRDERGKCVVEDMCNFDVTRLFEEGASMVGMVVNLDEHGQSGSHWVSVFFEYSDTRCGAYYYDSTSDPPHKDIMIFMKDMRDRMTKYVRSKEKGDTRKRLVQHLLKSQSDAQAVLEQHGKRAFRSFLVKHLEKTREKFRNNLVLVGKYIRAVEHFLKHPSQPSKIHSAIKQIMIIVDMNYNRRKRQRENTECGVFCLAFLALMVETKLRFDEVCNMIPYDADVHMLREIFFVS